VTWQARHFGFTLTHTSVISGYDRPRFFEDSMTQGMFASFVHQHFFIATDEGTSMRDELRFTAPLGPLGIIAEKLVLRKYLRTFLVERNQLIQRVAESDQAWKHYVGD
jgi:ligand-binding SRPBCC domain-containing protein